MYTNRDRPNTVTSDDYLQELDVEDIKIMKHKEARLKGAEIQLSANSGNDIYIDNDVWELLGESVWDIDKYDDTTLTSLQCHILVCKLQDRRSNVVKQYRSQNYDKKLQGVATMITCLISWIIINSPTNNGITIYGA